MSRKLNRNEDALLAEAMICEINRVVNIRGGVKRKDLESLPDISGVNYRINYGMQRVEMLYDGKVIYPNGHIQPMPFRVGRKTDKKPRKKY